MVFNTIKHIFGIHIPRFFYERKIRKRFIKQDITIISQNCVGGVLYNSLNLPFYSPTINLTIEGEDFVKLVGDINHYFSVDAIPFVDIGEKYRGGGS